MPNRLLAVLVMVLGLAGAGPVGAMMSDGGDVNLPDIEKLIAERKFDTAVQKLQDYTEKSPWDPDGFNLMGYSQRNLGRFAEAKAAYDRALRLDPAHAGALEYLGELYLQTGEPEKAREQLLKLEEVCGTGCQEYQTLAKAIDAQK